MSVSTDTMMLRQRREAIVQEHMDAENRHDVDATLATFHRPCYDVVPVNEMHDGSDSVRDLWDGIFSALPDWHCEPGPMFHADDAVFVEVRMTGTQMGEWQGIPATGRPIDVRVGCLFEFEDDRLLCERVYFDFLTILRQLGVA